MIQYLYSGMRPLPPQTSELIDQRRYDEALDRMFQAAAIGHISGSGYLSGLVRSEENFPPELRKLVTDRLDSRFSLDPARFQPVNAPPELKKRAHERIDKAGKENTPDGRFFLALKLLNSADALERLPEALRLLDTAADQKHPGALLVLGLMDREVLAMRGLESRYVKDLPR